MKLEDNVEARVAGGSEKGEEGRETRVGGDGNRQDEAWGAAGRTSAVIPT